MKYVVGFSGGADSQATALWVRRHYPAADIYLMFSDTGNEHPVTLDFIERYSRTIHPVQVVRPQVQDMLGRAVKARAAFGLSHTDPLTFDLLAKLKGMFPSTKARFCTSHLKLYPQVRWCYEHGARGVNQSGDYGEASHVEGPLAAGYARYIGVRRDESVARALVDAEEYDDLFHCQLHRPIADWTKEQVFAAISDAGEEYNPLYTWGFGRVGCAPCINASKGDIRLWAARFPEMIQKVRDWEASVGRTFFPPILPNGDGTSRHGWIDEVVDWSRTEYGGKKYSLPLLEADVESGVCMSKYGLCE